MNRTVRTLLSAVLLLALLLAVALAVPSANITEEAAERYEIMAFGE